MDYLLATESGSPDATFIFSIVEATQNLFVIEQTITIQINERTRMW